MDASVHDFDAGKREAEFRVYPRSGGGVQTHLKLTAGDSDIILYNPSSEWLEAIMQACCEGLGIEAPKPKEVEP